jgi:hypothetical protein
MLKTILNPIRKTVENRIQGIKSKILKFKTLLAKKNKLKTSYPSNIMSDMIDILPDS